MVHMDDTLSGQRHYHSAGDIHKRSTMHGAENSLPLLHQFRVQHAIFCQRHHQLRRACRRDRGSDMLSGFGMTGIRFVLYLPTSVKVE